MINILIPRINRNINSKTNICIIYLFKNTINENLFKILYP